MESFKQLKKDLTRFSAFLTLVFSVPYQTDKKIKNITFAYICGAVIASLIGIFEVLINFLKNNSLIFATGTMHKVFYGEVLAVAAGLAIIKTLKEKENKIIWTISCLIILFALVLNQTRGAILGLIIILFGYLILIKPKRKSFVLFLLIFVAFNAVFSVFKSDVRTRLLSIPKGMVKVTTGNLPEKIESAARIDGSTQIRLIMWKTGIKIIKDYPVFGVGPKGLKKVLDKYCPYLPQVEKAWSNLHNLYIHQAAERGLVGLFALLFLLFSILYKGFVFFKKTHGMFSMAAVSIMCGFFVMNLTETSFQHAVISMAVFFIFSLSLREKTLNNRFSANNRL